MRSLIEEASVREAVDEALDKWPRANDAWMAVQWAIARDPEIGDPVTESGNIRSFAQDGARSIGLPTVRVMYELQEPYVIIREVLFEDSKYGLTGHA